MKKIITIILLNVIIIPTYSQFIEIDKGLYYGEFKATKPTIVGNNIINVLKINPNYYDLHMYSAKQEGEKIKQADIWAKEESMLAVINAGMYRSDFTTNMGYMKTESFVNNSKLNKDNTILAFDRIDTTVPPVQIIDLKCQDWNVLKHKYKSFTQSIRMVDCNQSNRWSQQDKIWSMVVVAMDKEDNLLFIFTRSPHSVHDFVDVLLELPLNIYNVMYLEGGPEASFYLNHNGAYVAQVGSYETGFNEADNNKWYWKIPNVIGIKKIK